MIKEPPLPPMAPLPRDQRNIDADHLTLLAVFHFVIAGFALLVMVFLPLHYLFMHAILTNQLFAENGNQKPPPPVFFTIFKLVYVVIEVWCLVLLVLNLLSGWFIRGRKHRTFSLVVAAIDCLNAPIGTMLGIFTIIVLVRPSVRGMFETTG
jgi:hypothetical protein